MQNYRSNPHFCLFFGLTTFDSPAVIPVSHVESKAIYSLTVWIFNLKLLYCTPVIFTSIHYSDRILHYK